MVSGHLDKILNKFKTMVQLSDSELGTLPKVAYGCVNNLSCENGLWIFNYNNYLHDLKKFQLFILILHLI